MEKRILGRTRLEVGRLGMAASFDVPAKTVQQARERGVNYLYWAPSGVDLFKTPCAT